jgi:hypothetical protein
MGDSQPGSSNAVIASLHVCVLHDACCMVLTVAAIDSCMMRVLQLN